MKCETCSHKDVCRFIDVYEEAVNNFGTNDYLEVTCKKYQVPQTNTTLSYRPSLTDSLIDAYKRGYDPFRITYGKG